jgi:8-oxo-dGTP pyrophosphatase MutT (NUDIX family)
MTRVDKMEPGQTLNTGEVTVPREAATVILLRGGDTALEVLLLERTHAARFMAGAWVFPGGAVDTADGSGDAAHRAAAVRELAEEADVHGVDPEGLVLFSHWITPTAVKVRFDTRFFLATLPEDAVPKVDGEECVDLGWFAPADALAARERDELLLMFPTAKHLEWLARFDTAEALLEHARGQAVEPLEPRLVTIGDERHVLLPGEPGYEG